MLQQMKAASRERRREKQRTGAKARAPQPLPAVRCAALCLPAAGAWVRPVCVFNLCGYA